MNSPRSRVIACYNDRIVLKFDRHLDSATADVPVQFQNNYHLLQRCFTGTAAIALQHVYKRCIQSLITWHSRKYYSLAIVNNSMTKFFAVVNVTLRYVLKYRGSGNKGVSDNNTDLFLFHSFSISYPYVLYEQSIYLMESHCNKAFLCPPYASKRKTSHLWEMSPACEMATIVIKNEYRQNCRSLSIWQIAGEMQAVQIAANSVLRKAMRYSILMGLSHILWNASMRTVRALLCSWCNQNCRLKSSYNCFRISFSHSNLLLPSRNCSMAVGTTG